MSRLKRTLTAALAASGILFASGAFAAGEIQLVNASSRVTSFRGPPIQTLTADILVRNVGPGKKVGLRYRKGDGAWADAWGTYLHTVGDGRERWQVFAYPCEPYSTTCAFTDPDFAAQMQANGQAWWDNNNGANYHLNQQSGYRLMNGFKVFALHPGSIQRWSGPTPTLYLAGRVLVENLGSPKALKLVYSVDGWRSRAEAPLTFIESDQMYPPERFANPGEFGGEAYSFSFNPPDGQVLEYFLQYTVGGESFYDSNFGRNYRLAIPEHPSLSVRGTPTAWQPQSMMPVSGIDAGLAYSLTVDVPGHDPRERFKFDVLGDWTLNYGENDNGGFSRSGIAERNGGDIQFMDGPGLYRIRFENRSHAFAVEKQPHTGAWRRTVVFIYGRTVFGQDMYVRGGIDHAYSRDALGKPCLETAAYENPCAIPMRHRVRSSQTNFLNDTFLDWYGKEPGQTSLAEGSPLTWTTDDPAYPKTVARDSVGYTPVNKYGEHYWMLDVDMDCTRGTDGWFELKSYISNGPGWEADVRQPGAPYVSGNHFGKCGMINVFRRGESAAQIVPF